MNRVADARTAVVARFYCFSLRTSRPLARAAVEGAQMDRGWKRWGRVARVVAVIVVGEVCGVGLQDVFAENDHARRRWQTPEELIGQGHLAAPGSILEVHFSYDADAAPSLRVKRAVVKEGYAPQYEPLDAGYVLSLHSERGDTLSSLVFQIPNQVFNPPPEGDEPADGSPLILRAVEFALTVSLVPEAVELRVTDPQGLLLIEESLGKAPVHRNRPNFRSLPAEPSSDGSAPWDWWMPSAEAATTDGMVLDVAFVGDNYTSTDLLTYQQDVDRVLAHMMTYEPYALRSAQLLFHSVDNTTVDLGCVHNTTTTRLITCNQSTVTSVVNDAGAPYDKIVVLVKDSTYGGSGSSAMAVSYNGGSAEQVVVHEFGHTLGSLLDEYNLYSTNGTVDGRTYVNCYAGAPPNTVWDGLVAASDYAQGCKYPNWYRSSSCSIMKSLSCRYFNAVSQRQLNTKLDVYAGSTTTATAPSLTLSAVPLLVALGGASTLSWSASNVTTCSASGGWSGDRPASGSESVSPAATTTFTLTCAGSSSSVAQSVTVAVDLQAPSVSLTAPADGATVSGNVTVSASATDDQGVARVDFYRDSVLLGSDNTPPYSVRWRTKSVTRGAHTLTAKAFDPVGNTATTNITVYK
ncbi:MAG: Ig-like domain-containing protein [Candidatus Omnitrophota bacterium]|nr:Ig-like domain-containing protein [Candidatus Omnitrophota bacterium]